MNWKKEISHIGDILAIPLFALAIYYFYGVTNKNWIEWILLIFVSVGLIFDIFFTILYISSKK